MLADVFAIIGVLYFSWNAFRIVGFYWLDTFISIIFFLIYFTKIGRIGSVISFLASLAMMSVLMYIYLMSLLYFKKEIDGSVRPVDWHLLFYPFYDISIFLILSAFSHYHRLRKILRLDYQSTELYNISSTVFGMLLVPCLLFLSIWIHMITGNLNLSMVLSLIIMRNIVEFWRFKTLLGITIEQQKKISVS